MSLITVPIDKFNVSTHIKEITPDNALFDKAHVGREGCINKIVVHHDAPAEYYKKLVGGGINVFLSSHDKNVFYINTHVSSLPETLIITDMYGRKTSVRFYVEYTVYTPKP